MGLFKGRGGAKGGTAQPAGGQQTPPSTDAEKQAAAQRFIQGARSSGLNRMNVFGGGRGGSAQPQEGGQAGTAPQGRGFMKNSGGMMGTVFSRLQATPGFGLALAKNKAMRGASTQGMKKGGSVSARADGIAKKGKTKGRMV